MTEQPRNKTFNVSIKKIRFWEINLKYQIVRNLQPKEQFHDYQTVTRSHHSGKNITKITLYRDYHNPTEK